MIRPSKSQYASTTFQVPKSGCDFRLVVDYRKVNSKITFDSYPMSSVVQSFEHFAGVRVFSVVELNSAYFQIPFTPAAAVSRRFATPLGYLKLIVSPWGSARAAKL